MSTKSELIRYKNKCFKDSNDLSVLQFDNNISSEKEIEIKKQQDKAYKKYEFLKGLSKAYDKNKELEKESRDYEDCFFCSNCRELYPIEEMGTSELARMDRICKYCMEGRGYGS